MRYLAPTASRIQVRYSTQEMIQMAVDTHYRDKNGEISRKHGNTLIRTLRIRTDMHV